jgi:phospholipid/cholesterol/gamma-HCH transport system ATP-binding protein
MIEVKNIHKSFKDKHVLKGISTTFEEGKTSLIIGGSGSGKTVLIKSMVGLYPIDEGEILYDNRTFAHLDFSEKRAIRKEIGMVFQGGALFDSLTIEQNIMLPIDMFTNQSQEEKLDRINFVLNRVNLENVNNLFPSEISGGMQKRVSIARAIVMQPKYLFCDEPNSGLDPKTAIVIDNLIREITQEYGIVTVINTHDMNSVMEIGDKISFVHEGHIEWEGDKNSILDTDNEILNDFVYCSVLLKRIKR